MRILVTSLFIGLFLMTISACSTPNYGTSIKFDSMATNPEPAKSAMVYVYRKDGIGYGFRAKLPILANVINQDDSKIPVVTLQNNMFRPYLFEPKKIKFSSPAAFSEEMILKPGETRCIEFGWHYRLVDIVTVNEIPLKDCLENLKDMELVKSLNDIRKGNNAAPLTQIGFKELIHTATTISPN